MRCLLSFCLKTILLLFGTNVSALPNQVTKHGPNCWNAALVYSGVINHLRFMGASEFDQILRSKVCKKVQPLDAKKGDIRVYTMTFPQLVVDDHFVHANVFLNPTWSFNKMTLFLTSRLNIVPESDVYKVYGQLPNIFIVHKTNGETIKCTENSCNTQLEYYRCSSLDKELAITMPEIYGLYLTITNGLQTYVLLDPQTSVDDVQKLRDQISKQIVQFDNILQTSCNDKNCNEPTFSTQKLRNFLYSLTSIKPFRTTVL